MVGQNTATTWHVVKILMQFDEAMMMQCCQKWCYNMACCENFDR
jgi:hypothetical protein